MRTHSSFRRRIAALSAAVLGVGLVPTVAMVPNAAAAPTDLFFSEYVEGSSNNKALEVYNGTGSPVDLAGGQYAIQQYSNGAVTAGLTVPLTGTLAAGDVFVLAHSSADPAILAEADLLTAAGLFNGDDALALTKAGTNLDVIGQIGLDPGTAWGSGDVSTLDHTLRRKAAVEAGDPDGANSFDPSVEWDGFPINTFDGLGSVGDATPPGDTAPTVTATSPANLSTNVAVDRTLSVTFSEPVRVAGGAFGLSCSVSDHHTVTVAGGPTTFTLDPTPDLAAGDTCTLTVTGTQVTDTDADDPPDTMATDLVVTFTTIAADACEGSITSIPAIQGSGATVAITGSVTTEGVVVGDYEGASPNLRGFFIQARTGDDDPTTSDGIFVFEGSNEDSVALGDFVRVTGNAGENQGQSQISLTSDPVVCGTGTVQPTDLVLPADETKRESMEGMLVRLPQELSVTEHFQLGRFSQVTLSQGGRLQQPTNVVEPGAAALALQAENDRRAIILDDASQMQNPDPIVFARGGQPLSASNTLRGGDTATGIVGVLTYTWGGNAASPNAYRVRPFGALEGTVDFEPANPRPTASPDIDAGTRIAGMNLLNYFNTFTGCRGGEDGPPLDCRGADDAVELDRQTAKTVAAISGTNADVVAFMEMENDGYGAASAESSLVDRLNERDGAGTWAFIDPDQATGEHNSLGSDAIKVGMLYQPARVTPVGTTAVLGTVDFVNAGTDSPKNRPALAQAFRDNEGGGVFIGVANHLKSKGSGCGPGGLDDDRGDGQGNCSGARTHAAKALATWLATDPTHTADPDVLILGDLNSYAKEDPIAALKAAGFHNLIEEAHGDAAYSYVFDGQWGYLDHALGSAGLTAQVAGVEDWHINADEPSVLDYNTDFKSPQQVADLYAPDEFRISDHDPVVVGLDLTNDAPVLGAVTTTPTRVGAALLLTASFTDADRIDTHTATVSWGDGTATSSGLVTEADGSGTVTASHVYAAAGLYQVTVTVSDGYHPVTASTRAVVFDPAAGFVTGGGWFQSPAGALVADPSARGRAVFGMAVKYQRSATPRGAVTLALAGASFAVVATSFDWLVVADDTATFTGPATVNGRTGYRVEAAAVDGGRSDTLHVVVRDASGALVYDGGTQRIQGQITLHGTSQTAAQ